MRVARSPEELAAALETVPRAVLLRSARLWERATDEHLPNTRKTTVVQRVSRWALDPAALARLVEELPAPERQLLAVARACPETGFLELLCGAAALGLGDLLEPAGRCAALGLLLPLPERLRPGALWEDGRRLRHPAEAAELVVAEPVLELPLEFAITPVESETDASAEPALHIPPEDCLAAALSTGAALVGEPLALTRAGAVSVRAARATARAGGASPDLPLGFRLAVLDALRLLSIAPVGDRRRLVVPVERIEPLWRSPEAMEEVRLRLLESGVPAWAVEAGDTAPDRPEGFVAPADLPRRSWRDVAVRVFLTWFATTIPPGEGWRSVARLAAQAVRRAPAWMIGQRAWWYSSGQEPWRVGPSDLVRFEAYAVLHLARTEVRCGRLELGRRAGGASAASLPSAAAPEAVDSGSEPELVERAAALYVRRLPERSGPGEASHPRLSGDLELHVPRGALPCADAVLAGVIAEPLEGSPGDPVRGYRITAASVARAASLGVPEAAVERLLSRCRPAPGETALRRVREWLRRSGGTVIRRGWTLARWRSPADRDRAIAALPGARAAGGAWAALPPTVSSRGSVISLPGALLGMGANGELVATDPDLLRLALAAVARVDARGTVQPDRARIEGAGLTPEDAAAALQAWAGTSTAVGEAAALAVRRALGIRAQAGVLDATVLLPPSAVAASRIAAELEALRIQAVPLGSRALLIAGVPDRRTLAAAARAAGFDLQQARASMLLEVLPDSLLAGEGLDEFEELTVRAARARLEQAMATGRPLRLLLPGRRRPRSVTAEVFELDRLDGLLTVWLRILDGPGAGRREAHHLRDIPGYGPLV